MLYVGCNAANNAQPLDWRREANLGLDLNKQVFEGPACRATMEDICGNVTS